MAIYFGETSMGVMVAFTCYRIISGGFACAARVITDRNTGKSRGFGFVNYSSVDSASEAINKMDGQVSDTIFVSSVRVLFSLVLHYMVIVSMLWNFRFYKGAIFV